MNCPTALASSTTIAEEVVAVLERRTRRRRAAEAGASRLARRRGEPRGAQAVCRQEHRQLRHAGRGDRRVHAARALLAGAGRADAHAAVAARGPGSRYARRHAIIDPRRIAAGRSRAVRGRGQGAARRLRHSRGADRGRARPRPRSARWRSAGSPSTAPAWSRSCPTTSRTSPTSAACGWGWSAPRRPQRAAEDMLQRIARLMPDGAHQGLHGAADDPPPRRARADPRHVGRSRRSGR